MQGAGTAVDRGRGTEDAVNSRRSSGNTVTRQQEQVTLPPTAVATTTPNAESGHADGLLGADISGGSRDTSGDMLPPSDASPEGGDSTLAEAHAFVQKVLAPRTRVKLTLRQQIWVLFDDPTSSMGARVVAFLVMSLIGLSTASFTLQTLPELRGSDMDYTWGTIETVCVACFTAEYLARLLTCPKLLPFLGGLLNIIDLVAILPYYLELFIESIDGSSSTVFRVIRLIRVFRILKVSRYVGWVKVFTGAMVQSAQPLGMLLFVMAIGCILFSSAIYFAERGTWDPDLQSFVTDDGLPSQFQSIPASFWWCIVTMTTVGYGDMVPTTTVGKLIASVAALCGILVLAIPITVISTNFNNEYLQMTKSREAAREQMLAFRRYFNERRRGLAAIHDELDEIVKRSTVELQEEFNALSLTAQDELAHELRLLIKLAYEQRQKLLIRQGAAYKGDHDIDTGGGLLDDMDVRPDTEREAMDTPVATINEEQKLAPGR